MTEQITQENSVMSTTKTISNQKKLKKLPVYLTRDEIKDLFNVIKSPRDLMLLQTIYYLGTRIGETLLLEKDDIKFSERTVVIRAETAKRSKSRRIPIPSNFFKPLQQWCSLLKLNRLFDITTRQRARQIIIYYSKLAGIKKKVSPHKLRHSYATHVYEKTKDIKLVQELLGHENPSTTMIYTHLDDKSKHEGIKDVF